MFDFDVPFVDLLVIFFGEFAKFIFDAIRQALSIMSGGGGG